MGQETSAGGGMGAKHAIPTQEDTRVEEGVRRRQFPIGS